MVTFFLNEAAAGGVDPMTIVFIVVLVVLVAALLVVPMFTNKKRAKQTDELHRSLKPGDVIKTVGGIIGTIKEIREISPVDREMVIETGDGDNKTTMVFDINALYQVMSRSNTVVAPQGDPDKEFDSVEEEAPVAAESTAEEETPVSEDAPAAEQATAETPAEAEQPVETTEQTATAPEAAKPSQKKPVKRAKK